LDFDS